MQPVRQPVNYLDRLQGVSLPDQQPVSDPDMQPDNQSFTQAMSQPVTS